MPDSSEPVDERDAGRAPAAERGAPRAGPRHAAGGSEGSHRPSLRGSLGEGEHARSERARTPDAGQRSSDVIPNDNAEHASELVAANGLRLLAFTIDLLLIAVATIPIAMAETGSRPFMFVTVLLAFVLYHAASVWLTSGKTIGKVACNLTCAVTVARLEGPARVARAIAARSQKVPRRARRTAAAGDRSTP